MERRPTIALDYDGTIVSNAWPEHGDPEPNAARNIKHLLKTFDIIIHTSRIAPVDMEGSFRTGTQVAKEITAIHNKLRKMGLPWLPIHQLPWKPGADLYLDDKGMHYNGNWDETLGEIVERFGL
jgi:hypothetical protein